MLNQMKTGEFIAKERKEKGMTQKDLADALGISDKTISKWETGRGMPDLSLMGSLCDTLEISVNELLAGERLSGEGFARKAEENIMELMKGTQERTRAQKGAIAAGIFSGVVGFMLFLSFMIAPSGLMIPWGYFVDGISLFGVVGLSIFMLAVSGQLGSALQGIALVLRRGNVRHGGRADREQIRQAEYALSVAIRIILLCGVFGFLYEMQYAIHYTEEGWQMLTAGLGVTVLPLLYAHALALLLCPFQVRLHRLTER
ncbi:MAG: helix-turn-helix domain-containing protein [Lachnospiraceae bacterium]|nr:helix-turn-helix domain-containing protein [Lachnospiraceae bacterium]